MKRTYIHTFKNGNKCRLELQHRARKPVAYADWEVVPSDSQWREIEEEYVAWRAECVADFLGSLLST